ncbi:4Fe-4S dicluster domain-containing protein [Spirochaetota bacterium]
MARYGMVIDLKKCIGCTACVVACKSEHNSPTGVFNTTILEKEMGIYPNSTRIFLPVMCNHCEKPTCVDVCPTGASYQRDDGVVLVDYDKCTGCSACIEHCPYQVRSNVKDNRRLFFDGKTAFERPVHDKIPNNVAAKCDLCYHKIDQGEEPACAAICMTEARIFGDLDDKDSKICRQIELHEGWTMLPDEETEPKVYYIGDDID